MGKKIRIFAYSIFLLLITLESSFGLSLSLPNSNQWYQSRFEAMYTHAKTNAEFRYEVYAILGRHEFRLEQFHATLQTILAELQVLRTSQYPPNSQIEINPVAPAKQCDKFDDYNDGPSIFDEEPSLVNLYSNLRNMMKAQGLMQDAYNCYIEALRIQPTIAIALFNLAGLFMNAGDHNKALQYYKEAVKLKPNFPDTFLNLGNVCKALGMPQEAIVCYHYQRVL